MTADVSLSCEEALVLIRRPDVVLVDVRESIERERDGVIPGSLHAPFTSLIEYLRTGGGLQEAAAAGKRLIFYCAHGPRSMQAAQAADHLGFAGARYIDGGIAIWAATSGPIDRC